MHKTLKLNQLKTFFYYTFLASALIFTTSCENEEDLNETNTPIAINEGAFRAKYCATQEYYLKMAAQYPEIAKEQERIDAMAKQYASKSAKKSDEEIVIPVIVHILYNTPEQNIKWSQVRSQIDALNRDFNKENEDLSKVPNVYKDRVADVGIRFELERITRTKTDVVQWRNNLFDITLPEKGGKRISDPTKYLNIYVGNFSPDFAGAALSPSGRITYPERDAVLVNLTHFGTEGTAIEEYRKGRTAAHEIGHWLNLIHLTGLNSFKGCERNGGDGISDTPKQSIDYLGSITYPDAVSCNTRDMVMNFMQAVFDESMFMFTNGQKDRMRSTFEPGGPRATFK